MNTEKQAIIDALYAFIRQRPGMDPRNYGYGMNGWRAYRSESRSITRDLHDARELLRSVELRDSITAEDLKQAFRAYSGRLACEVTPVYATPAECPGVPCSTECDHRTGFTARLSYCTGQYFPTEYRKAVAAVCASALWDRRRQDMPEPDSWRVKLNDDDGSTYTSRQFKSRAEADHYLKTVAKSRVPYVQEYHGGKSPGDWIRSSFRREYGPRLASRWFD